MSLVFDEFGRPIIVLRDQGSKKRIKGLEAHKVPTQTILQIFNINLCYYSPTSWQPGLSQAF